MNFHCQPNDAFGQRTFGIVIEFPSTLCALSASVVIFWRQSSMPLECDQCGDILADGADLVGAAELRQVDDEGTADHLRAGALEQLDGREAGTARGDQIV